MSTRRIRVVCLSQTSMMVLSYRCLFQLLALLRLYRDHQTIRNCPPFRSTRVYPGFWWSLCSQSLVLCVVFVPLVSSNSSYIGLMLRELYRSDMWNLETLCNCRETLILEESIWKQTHDSGVRFLVKKSTTLAIQVPRPHRKDVIRVWKLKKNAMTIFLYATLSVLYTKHGDLL